MRRMATSAALLILLAGRVQSADFLVTQTRDDGAGSFRQAILDANAAPGADRIVFNIPGAGVKRINVGSNPLPVITDTLTIDGYTQTGAAANTLAVGDNARILIEIRRTHLPNESNDESYDGLVLQAAGCTIRGLSVTGFRRGGGYKDIAKGVAILAGSAGRHLIEGNFLGLPPDGASTSDGSAPIDNLYGIRSESPGNQIGGVSPASRNVISNNLAAGVVVRQGAVKIEGNYIGTDANGSKPVQNRAGISIDASGSSDFAIGGVTSGAGNVISGNGDGGGLAMANGTNIRVQGNLIGTAANAIDPLPNSVGIEIFAASDNLIGDPDGKGRNVIAFNASYGIYIAGSGVGNRIVSNRIFLNDQNPNANPQSCRSRSASTMSPDATISTTRTLEQTTSRIFRSSSVTISIRTLPPARPPGRSLAH